MNRKSLLSTHIFLLLVLFSGSLGADKLVYSNPSATISLSPSARVLISQNFTLNLSVSDVTDLYLWVTTIQWNSTVLNLTNYSEGPFLKQGGQTTFMVGKVTPGQVDGLTCSLQGSVPGVSGKGSLATLRFNATMVGATSINIIFSDLLNSAGESIPHNKINSTVTVTVPSHDVSVVSVKPLKTVVGQGCAISINATVQNEGDYAETFNVTTYANTTITGSENVTLPAGDSTTVTLSWNTTAFAKGNYTISAYTWPVRGETDMSDNNFTGGWVVVSMVGDLTGGSANAWDFVPDGVVDGSDLSIVAKCYGSWPGAQPPMVWNVNCDVNDDGVVDGSDLSIIARHFGEGSP
jgi:hypothetical protein